MPVLRSNWANSCIPGFQRLAFETCLFESAAFQMAPSDIGLKLNYFSKFEPKMQLSPPGHLVGFNVKLNLYLNLTRTRRAMDFELEYTIIHFIISSQAQLYFIYHNSLAWCSSFTFQRYLRASQTLSWSMLNKQHSQRTYFYVNIRPSISLEIWILCSHPCPKSELATISLWLR